jgi:hypothetical protein
MGLIPSASSPDDRPVPIRARLVLAAAAVSGAGLLLVHAPVVLWLLLLLCAVVVIVVAHETPEDSRSPWLEAIVWLSRGGDL